MTTNSLFHNASTINVVEQELYQNLVKESIQIRGIDMLYIPRETPNIDFLYGEDPDSSFTAGVIVEMLCESTTEFQGEADFMSRFGLDLRDESRFEIAVSRFVAEVTSQYSEITRPREGDLIWYALTHSLFEITYVTNREPFYQNGVEHVFSCTVKKHESSHEDFASGDPILDAGMVDDGEIEDKHEGSEATELKTEDVAEQIIDFTEDDPFGDSGSY